MALQAPLNSGLQAFIVSGLQAFGQAAGVIWYARGIGASFFVEEISASNLTVIRSVLRFVIGIGGNETTIWAIADPLSGPLLAAANVMELSVADFSVVRNTDIIFAHTGLATLSIGGDSNRIWAASLNSAVPLRCVELSTIDFSIVNTSALGFSAPIKIGGDANTVHMSGDLPFKFQSLSTDLTTILLSVTPTVTSRGFGGGPDRVWSATSPPTTFNELTPAYVVIRSKLSAVPESGAIDIGGK